MKKFKEWMIAKEQNLYMGRPYGQMGPDGRVYGHSVGPISQIPGSKTWASARTTTSARNPESEAEQVWKTTNPYARANYLSEVPDNDQKLYHLSSWEYLPQEIKQIVAQKIKSKSSFGQ